MGYMGVVANVLEWGGQSYLNGWTLLPKQIPYLPNRIVGGTWEVVAIALEYSSEIYLKG